MKIVSCLIFFILKTQTSQILKVLSFLLKLHVPLPELSRFNNDGLPFLFSSNEESG